LTRRSKQAPRPVLSNWKGSPCPACAQPLQYWSEDAPNGETVTVRLLCPSRHCWEERLSLKTMHSSIFVERRRDLEAEAPHRPPPLRARQTPPV
jgi:hypothetical protein